MSHKPKVAHEEALNYVLRYLDNENREPETEMEIVERMRLYKPTDKGIRTIMHKLFKDEYVEYLAAKNADGQDIHDDELRRYFISYHGILFLSRGGYVSESNGIKRQKRFKRLAIAATVINAILILWLGWQAVSDGRQSPKQTGNEESAIIILGKHIDSLNIEDDKTRSRLDSTAQELKLIKARIDTMK